MAGYLHKRGDLVESDESIITIGYRDMFRLIGAINLTGVSLKINGINERSSLYILEFRQHCAMGNILLA
jgi:hypothetical protein